MEILSTREWATVIWAFIFFAYAMVHRQIREAFWDNVYIKDIMVWFVFSGLIYCMNAVSKEADEEYIRKVLKDNLKLTAILEFIISTFTFNIWVELVIIPTTTMIVIMNVIAERKEEYEKVHEYKELDTLNTFISFMIPIVYLILIIPLEYILELYSKYELLFVRMSFKEEKDKKIQRRHRWLVIKVCKLSVHKVLIFQKKYWCKMYSRMSVEGFEKLIEEFRNECNNER